MTLITPPALQRGDTIAIAATARKVSREEMLPAIKLLQSKGYVVSECRHLYAEDNQYAGNDSQRAADLQQALDNPDIKAVMFARGGYGTVRIIDQIDFSNFKKQPKWLIGFSDLTVLHSHVNHLVGVETIHAPMMINLASVTSQSQEMLLDIWKGTGATLEAIAHVLNRTGSAQGQLTGGNLSVLYSLLASPSDVDTQGKILFIEDLDEYYYHIDRMMQAFHRAGKLSGLAGLVVGGMSDMRDNQIPFGKNAETIIKEYTAAYDYPVCFGFPAGHINQNMPLIMGRQVQLSVDEKVVMQF